MILSINEVFFTKNKPVDLVRFLADVPDDGDAIVTRTSRLQQRPSNILGRDHVTAPGHQDDESPWHLLLWLEAVYFLDCTAHAQFSQPLNLEFTAFCKKDAISLFFIFISPSSFMNQYQLGSQGTSIARLEWHDIGTFTVDRPLIMV